MWSSVADAVGADSFHLVGHDWGGALAWSVAAAEPARLRSLTALNCPPIQMLQRELLRNPRQLARSWYMFVLALPRLPEWLLARRAERFVERSFRGTALRPEVFSDERLAPYIDQVQRLGLPGINDYRANLGARPRPSASARPSPSIS